MSETQTQNTQQAQAGLQDLIASNSSICYIDGPNCHLVYRGYQIEDLAQHSHFEEVVYLLLFGKMPNQKELQQFSNELASDRTVPDSVLKLLKAFPKKAHPMAVLRTMISILSFYDKEDNSVAYEENFKKAMSIIAKAGTIIAAWDRIRQGKKPIAPDPKLTYAEDFLRMVLGKKPDELYAKSLDLYLILLADHEFNASTFACRVTGSTLSDYYSAITSAVGVLKGPLHGGANEQVIKMIMEIGDKDKVQDYIEKALANKKKIMGFGHRVYKVKDPRSPILKDMAREVSEKKEDLKIFRMSEQIESLLAERYKNLPPNVDFYSASLLYNIGIPTDLFTPIFVMSRLAGWSAHYLEQISDNRLIRPRANYTGLSNLVYTPIQQR